MENSLDSGLPFAAFGVSSGGFFTPILATKIPTRALLLMTSQGPMDMVENATPENFPPTFFTYMNATVDPAYPTVNIFPNGISWKDAVELSMAILSKRGVSVGAKLCLPQPIRPLYFTEGLPCTSDEDSAKMQKAYKSAGWLDDADYLIEEQIHGKLDTMALVSAECRSDSSRISVVEKLLRRGISEELLKGCNMVMGVRRGKKR